MKKRPSDRRKAGHLLQVLVRALERGAVPAATALRHALRGERHLSSWVDVSGPWWERAPERRPAVRATPTYPADIVRAAVATAHRKHARKPGVISIHWGLARREGRSTTEAGVIITVRKKLADPRRSRIEPWLPVRHRGRTRWIRVDVHAAGERGIPQREIRPGNHAQVCVGDRFGALGALVADPNGDLHAVVSGHVAVREGLPVSARTIGGDTVSLGTVKRVVIGGEGDVAKTGPLANADAPRVATATPVDVYDVDAADLNTAVWIQTARDVSPRKAFITDVGATVPFLYEDGVKEVDGLIGTSHEVTEAGDSGGPAVDVHGRLVGFVVGSFDGRTYLIPARRALEDLET